MMNIIVGKNTEKSSVFARQYAEHIKPKDCYSNVLRMVLRGDFLHHHPKYLVAYGAVEIPVENVDIALFAKHAFFIDGETGDVIDPTIPAERDYEEGTRYIVAKTMNLNDYLSFVLDDKTCDFWDNLHLRDYAQEMERWARQQGYVIL